MKKFGLYTLALCLAVFTFVSCSEKDRAFPEIQDSGQGAIPRLVEGITGDLDYEHPNNPDSSSLSFTVEFYDNNNGNNVTEYEWSVSYGDLFGPTVLRTFTPENFTTNADGLPQLSVVFTFDEIFGALGMTIADFDLTKDFLLDAKLRTNSGQEFGFDNTGPTVIGQPTFQALFRYQPPVTKKPCNSVLADGDDTDGSFGTMGEFDVKATATNQMAGIGWDGCEGNTFDSQVRLEASHDPNSFAVGSYQAFATNADITDVLDLSLGVFFTCYTGTITDATGAALPLGDLAITESCGKLGWEGSSQWGEIYEFVKVEVSGATLTLGWINDYGEGGEAELTRTDGQAWQIDLFCEGC